ncbi:MAG: DivIVA domain-containing protein [Candidatus Omnitrophica bacterium]|nr:DivIVA domain-containing protein [Candidatus Omnitrophota bacterium]MCK5393073.1 DivIVA domain-containing protein [Candidatus Omnitrophota bacterium]
MEVKLDSLIEKIKKDGVEEAKKASDEIIQKANKEAEKIINEAKHKAEKFLNDSKDEFEKLKNNTQSSLKQASRDLLLVLREQIMGVFDRIFKKQVSKSLTPDLIKQLIVKVVDNWVVQKNDVVEVLVNEDDKKKLEDLMLSLLKQEAGNMIEINIGKNVDKGFRIGIKGQDVYYDLTDESILEAIKEFINPSIAAMLDNNNG